MNWLYELNARERNVDNRNELNCTHLEAVSFDKINYLGSFILTLAYQAFYKFRQAE